MISELTTAGLTSTTTTTTSTIATTTESNLSSLKISKSGYDSPSLKLEEPLQIEVCDKKGPTGCSAVKSKKSFCIDALLARNESKNLFATDSNLGEVRCNTEIARCFRKNTGEVKKLCDEDEDHRKTFLDAFEKRTHKPNLFENFNAEKTLSDDSDNLYGAVPGKISREVDGLEYERRKFDEVDISDSKMGFFQDRIQVNSPEYDIRREYENSRSESPFSGKSNETRSNSPGGSEISSPPISPGNENEFRGNLNGPGDEFRGSQIFPRPGLLVTANGPQSFINQNPNLMLGSRPNLPQLGPHSAFLAYSSPHSFTSAFHPLNANSTGNVNSKVSGSNGSGIKTGVSTNSENAILGLNAGGSQHLHHMQLEWLARTGMFYPRLPDLAGIVPSI